jgi:hypothetical protein
MHSCVHAIVKSQVLQISELHQPCGYPRQDEKGRDVAVDDFRATFRT